VHLLTARSEDARLTLAGREVPYHLVAFPVKPSAAIVDGRNVVRHLRQRFAIGQSVPGWACVADPALIGQSCLELVALADAHGWRRVLLPRPGCGAGELDWAQDVRPLLCGLLDDRFTAITF